MNLQQLEAATAPKGMLQIVAGPGTGKTRTLVARINHFLESGIPPESIIVLTFTNAAAKEARIRVNASQSGSNYDASKIVMGTFHSVGRRFLHRHDWACRLASDADTNALVKDFAVSPKIAKGAISALKNGRKASGIRVPNATEMLAIYSARLAKIERLDFDDLLLEFLRLLKEHPHAADHVQAVLVDEFQDTNGTQLDIALQLAKACNNLTVVGDPDQSIYGWRNADPRNFDKLVCAGSKSLRLTINYRSTQGILDYASRIVADSCGRLNANGGMQSTTGILCCPQLVSFPDSEVEARDIAASIEDLVSRGVRSSDIAVLCRNSHQSRALQRSLVGRRIAFRTLGGKSLTERRLLRSLLDYLRLVLDAQDTLALQRLVLVRGAGETKLCQGLGPSAVKTIFRNENEGLEDLRMSLNNTSGLRNHQKNALERFVLFVEGLRSAFMGSDRGADDVAELIEKIACGLLPPRPEKEVDALELGELAEEDWKFVDEMKHAAATFELDSSMAEDEPFLASFVWTWDSGSQSDPVDTEMVTISTIHSAKGLEWSVVFLLGCDSSLAPDPSQLEEMRRLLYVAVTRAKIISVITHTGRLCGLLPEKGARRSGQIVLDYAALAAHLDYQFDSTNKIDRHAEPGGSEFITAADLLSANPSRPVARRSIKEAVNAQAPIAKKPTTIMSFFAPKRKIEKQPSAFHKIELSHAIAPSMPLHHAVLSSLENRSKNLPKLNAVAKQPSFGIDSASRPFKAPSRSNR